jgi:hypothetical protein
MSTASTHSLNKLDLSKDKIFSKYSNAKSTVKTGDITEKQYIALVKNVMRKAEIERLRALPEEEYKIQKIKTACITGSVINDDKGRKKENIICLNGLAFFDIDEKDNKGLNMAELKEVFKKDKFIRILHYSLSGRGVCGSIQVPEGNAFNEIYLSLQDYFLTLYGVEIDLLADETRLRFISYDPEVYYNPEAAIYTDTMKPAAVAKKKDNFKDDPFVNIEGTPAKAFNKSIDETLKVIDALLEEKGFIVTVKSSEPIREYQGPENSPKTIVCFSNEGVLKFHIFSPNTFLPISSYPAFDLFKGATELDDFDAQEALHFKFGFGKWNQPAKAKPIKSGRESYTTVLNYLKKDSIRLNLLTGNPEVNGLPINDFYYSTVVSELSILTKKNQSKEIVKNCIDVICSKNQFHSFFDFIEVLKTLLESTGELDKLVDCFTSSTPRELILIYFKRWLLGLFDLHLLKRMTKNVLVVSGTQNSCKTSLVKNILPESLKQYGKTIDFKKYKLEDSKVELCSLLVACFDEFEEVLNSHKGQSDFKNVTSSYDILMRRPYRANPEQMYRQSIVMATTNESQILTDPTGNTRFLTIDVQAFDLQKYLKIDMLKVWREIYDLHLAGQTSVLTDSERQLQANENKNFEAENIYIDLIEANFEPSDKTKMTATEIMQKIQFETREHLSIKRIGQALKKLGFERLTYRSGGGFKQGYGIKAKF